jgi:hypothetical protein
MTDFGLHPSQELRTLFASMEIPHQGQDPSKGCVIFVGMDANYSPLLSDYPDFFRRILEYHEDGVGFWHRHGVHHPFLLPEYPLPRNTGGVPYHKKFSAMGLTPEFAEHISFVELLDVPTTGRTDTKLFWQMFNVEHARRLDQLFRDGSERLVLLSNNVILRMLDIKKRHGMFAWLPSRHGQGLIKQIGQTQVHRVMHFSASVSMAHLQDLGGLIRGWCSATCANHQL